MDKKGLNEHTDSNDHNNEQLNNNRELYEMLKNEDLKRSNQKLNTNQNYYDKYYDKFDFGEESDNNSDEEKNNLLQEKYENDDVNKFITDNRLYLDKFYKSTAINSILEKNNHNDELKRLKDSDFYSSNHKIETKFFKNENIYDDINEINVKDIYSKYLGNYYDGNINEYDNDSKNENSKIYNEENSKDYNVEYFNNIGKKTKLVYDLDEKSNKTSNNNYDNDSHSSSTPQVDSYYSNSDLSKSNKDNNRMDNNYNEEFYKFYIPSTYEELRDNNDQKYDILNKISDLNIYGKNQSSNDKHNFYFENNKEGKINDDFNYVIHDNKNLNINNINNSDKSDDLQRNNSAFNKEVKNKFYNLNEDYIMKLELAKLINQSINKKNSQDVTLIGEDIKFDSDVCLIDRAFSNESKDMKLHTNDYKYLSLIDINTALEEEEINIQINKELRKSKNVEKIDIGDVILTIKNDEQNNKIQSYESLVLNTDINERLIDYSMRNSLNTLISSVDLLNEFSSLENISKNDILENILKNKINYDNIDYYISSLLSGEISFENLSLLRFIPNLSRFKKSINFDDICDILLFETNQEK